jgi:hypothetical protein
MKLGLKTIVLALAVALLCVPAAFAKNGNGHGKPSWAGGGGGNGHGKPAWAGQGKGHADKAKVKHEKVKHEKAGAEDAAAEDEELDLGDLNPSWYCKTLESMMDTADAESVAGGAEPGEFSSFDAEFGENDNKRNSHGKCVSRRAHGEDLAGAVQGPEEESSCEPVEGTDEEGTDEEASSDGPVDEEAAGDESTTTDEEPAAEEGSDEEAVDSEECKSDDSAGDDAEEGDEAEDEASEDGGEEASEDDGEDAEAAAFARALVRNIHL